MLLRCGSLRPHDRGAVSLTSCSPAATGQRDGQRERPRTRQQGFRCELDQSNAQAKQIETEQFLFKGILETTVKASTLLQACTQTYKCTHKHIHTNIHACTQTCMHKYTQMRTHANTCARTKHTHIHTNARTNTRASACKHMHTRHTCMQEHTHAHTSMHTHMRQYFTFFSHFFPRETC